MTGMFRNGKSSDISPDGGGFNAKDKGQGGVVARVTGAIGGAVTILPPPLYLLSPLPSQLAYPRIFYHKSLYEQHLLLPILYQLFYQLTYHFIAESSYQPTLSTYPINPSLTPLPSFIPSIQVGVVGGVGVAVVTRAGGVVSTVASVIPTVPPETIDRYTRLTFPVSSFIYKRVKNVLRRRKENKDLAVVTQQQQQQLQQQVSSALSIANNNGTGTGYQVS